VLVRLLYETRAHEKLRAVSLAMIIGGALGNLLDRLMSSRGVVDFIDVGIGTWRFWTFNVADMAIDIGIALFAWTLWRAGRHSSSAGGPHAA
jgi:signal peptidase II